MGSFLFFHWTYTEILPLKMSRRSSPLDKSPLSAAKTAGLVNTNVTYSSPLQEDLVEDIEEAQEQAAELEKRLSPPPQRRLSRFSRRSPRPELNQNAMSNRSSQLGSVPNRATGVENELITLGYTPVSWIGVSDRNNMQYLKAVNRRGQTVFILIDNEPGLIRTSDLTLIESKTGSSIPTTYRNVASQCTKDVCGVAFECGNDALCTLVQTENALEPEETNFVLVEQSPSSASATIESTEGQMSYPVVRLSEIRANPALVLENTDRAMRRLRNASYVAQLQELGYLQQSIITLNKKVTQFNVMRERVAKELNQSLTELEGIARAYDRPCDNPSEYEEREYSALQAQLLQRNQWIGSLINRMKMVADKRMELDRISDQIHSITLASNQDFANVPIIDYPVGYNPVQ